MVNINLLPLRIRQERVTRLRNILVFGAAGILAGCLLWLYLSRLSVYNDIRKQIATVNLELDSPELKEKVKLVEEIEVLKKDVDSKKSVLDAIRIEQSAWLTFLDDLSRRLVEGVWVVSIKKGAAPPPNQATQTKTLPPKGAFVDLDCAALSQESARAFLKNLQQSPNFSSVILLTMNDAKQDTFTYYRFRMSCALKNTLYLD